MPNTTDTSRTNVARVLRSHADAIERRDGKGFASAELRALAASLDATPDPDPVAVEVAIDTIVEAAGILTYVERRTATIAATSALLTLLTP
jgi:hypothetical protein